MVAKEPSGEIRVEVGVSTSPKTKNGANDFLPVSPDRGVKATLRILCIAASLALSFKSWSCVEKDPTHDYPLHVLPNTSNRVSSCYSEAWDHPNFRKNAFGVKKPSSELWEHSRAFSEQLSEFRK